MARLHRFVLAAIVVLAVCSPSSSAAPPLAGRCYYGVFHKQPIVSPRGWVIWPTDYGSEEYSDFSLIVSKTRRSLDPRSNAQFLIGEPTGTYAPAYDRLYLMSGSHKGRITADGKFAGASSGHNQDVTAGGDFYQQFRGQFLRHGRVILRFNLHTWDPSTPDHARTGWITARGKIGDARCNHDFPLF
jgi:hypothetical protein